MAAEEASQALRPLRADDPTAVAGYRIIARFGEDDTGAVFLADTPSGRLVTIKLIHQDLARDPEFRLRFRQEVQAAQRANTLYAASVIDSDSDDPQPWLATDYVAGPSLHDVVTRFGPLPMNAVAVLVVGIAKVLQVVHGAGLVHRDLTPTNILLTDDGPRVIDFGITRALESATGNTLTRTGAIVGSPGFMAPEQVRGNDITPATDVFALGLVAVYAATGTSAFGDNTSIYATLYRIVHEEPDLSGVPEELRHLISACLAKDPQERPSLDRVIESCSGIIASPEPIPPNGWLPPAVVADIDRNRLAVLSTLSTAPAPSASRPPLSADASPQPATATATATATVSLGSGVWEGAEPTRGVSGKNLYAIGLLACLFSVVLAAPKGAWWITEFLVGMGVVVVATAVVNICRGKATYEAVEAVGAVEAEGAESPLVRSSPRTGIAFLDGIADAVLFLRPRAAALSEARTRDACLHEAYNRLGPPSPDGAGTAGWGEP